MLCPRCSFRSPKNTLVCARCGEQAPRAIGVPYETRPPVAGPRTAVSQELQIDRRGRGLRAVGAARARQPMWVRGSEARDRGGLRTVPATPNGGHRPTSSVAPARSAPVLPLPSIVHHAKTEPGWHREPAPDLSVSRVSVAELPFEAPKTLWTAAPLSQRLGAALLDVGVVAAALALAVVAGAVAFGPAHLSPLAARGFDYVVDGLLLHRGLGLLLAGLGACLSLTYLTLANALMGATFGKRAFHLRIIDVDGERPGLGVSFARAVGSLASLAPALLGYVLALFDARRLTLHDRIVGTRVVCDLPEGGAADAPDPGGDAAPAPRPR